MTKKPCTNFTPSWFVGHWREWHRGHGCEQDDGKPRSDTATAEIAQRDAHTRVDSKYLTDAELRFLRASTTSGNDLLIRALDELAARRAAEKMRPPSFDHGKLAVKHFEPLLGYCVCPHCARLPMHASSDSGDTPQC